MKKIINHSVLLSAIFVAILTGCDIDNYKQLGALTDETVIVDEPTARAVLNGIYNKIRASNNGLSSVSLALSCAGVEQKPTANNKSAVAFYNNNVKATPVERRGTELYLFYQKAYGGINLANVFIKKIENGVKGLKPDVANEMLAEAKTLRANLYFNLLRVFGQFYDSNSEYGIITTTEVIDGFSKLKRSTVAETYKLIISDLEFGIKYAPKSKKTESTGGDSIDGDDWDYGDGDGDGDGDDSTEKLTHFYVSKTFAQALLAKVYLSKGGTENYEKTVELCETIFDNTDGFELEVEYSNIFKNSFNSKEVIFAPFYNEKKAETNQIDFTSNNSVPSEYLKKIADEQDGKVGNGDNEKYKKGYDPRFMFTFQANKFGFYAKYPDMSATYYYLRLAEVYLIYAEATIRAGGDWQLALGALNAIRDRAGVDPKEYDTFDENTFLEDVRKEKLLELCIENAEPWFDIVRYDRLGTIKAKDIKPTITNKNQLIMPIPLRAIANNSNFGSQNPGY